jgi:hypothetical protein
MTAFFIPGIAGDAPDIERACGKIRRQIELDLGRCPISRRILSLWTRRGTVDCITQVGSHDPVRGGTVVAIFDMGPHEPFVNGARPAACHSSGQYSTCSSATPATARPSPRSIANAKVPIAA